MSPIKNVPRKSRRGFVPVFGVFVIACVVVVAGYFLIGFLESKNQEGSAQQGMVSETSRPRDLNVAANISDWKTYTNAKYGFLLKYPPTWTFEAKPYNYSGTIGIIFFPPEKHLGDRGLIEADVMPASHFEYAGVFDQTAASATIDKIGSGDNVRSFSINGMPAVKFFGFPGLINSDIVFIKKQKTIISVDDIDQLHASDNVLNTMAFSIQ